MKIRQMKINSEKGVPPLETRIQDFYYSIAQAGHVQQLHKVLSLILENPVIDPKNRNWRWRIAEDLEYWTDAVEIIRDYDVSVETGDDGKPHYEGGENSIGVKIKDRALLLKLSEFVNGKVSEAVTASESSFANRKEWVWRCPRCHHFVRKISKASELESILLQTPEPIHCKKCRKLSWPWAYEGKVLVTEVEMGKT